MAKVLTYKTYYKLIKSIEDDPQVEKRKAARALARFMSLHPHNIAQKTEVMIEHFRAVTRHKIGGRAKAIGHRLSIAWFCQGPVYASLTARCGTATSIGSSRTRHNTLTIRQVVQPHPECG